ncbi:FkbM family methyltransferase [Tahibacter aquaticus]|uniref:FkbM family methyltransferase n=1 Tax=Tahibacter aquaticus TaxID=520092 RepID=A0A4R6YMH1_9GAMM|nr:FkbM family methyltransferase [Tahibacter aquaticus]TDR38601.1 FkbM family methyltransferase [Tahibacter aquaticus]
MIHSRLRLALPAYLQRRLRNACASWLARAGTASAAAQIACFPRDYIGRLIVANGLYDDLVLRCLFEKTFAGRLQAFRTGTALDVGANIGNHSTWFAHFFKQVVAFEPNPICVRLFEASVLMNRLQNVTLIAHALSDHDGEALLHANLHGNLGGSSLCESAQAGATQSFPVRLLRGDDALAQAAGLPPVRLVKLDVEGYEHAALRGLEHTLRSDRPLVVFESAGAHGPGGSVSILATLQRLGYRHTYVVESDADRRSGLLRRLLQRIARGYSLNVVHVEQPEDRFHSHIIASVDAL